jgi:AcrR family transcriptional regulator
MAQPETKPKRRSQEDRVKETRDAVYEAILTSLDERGYSATTFSAVQQLSGLSRGALTYHFASKLEMITFACRRLLEAAIRPTQAGAGTARAAASGNVADFLMFHWRHVVNTREGRAFIEIIVASRTDSELDSEIGPMLEDWDAKICRSAVQRFTAVSGSEEDAALLWSMARTFLRGLIIHGRFLNDPAQLEQMVNRFGQMLAEEVRLKGVER